MTSLITYIIDTPFCGQATPQLILSSACPVPSKNCKAEFCGATVDTLCGQSIPNFIVLCCEMASSDILIMGTTPTILKPLNIHSPSYTLGTFEKEYLHTFLKLGFFKMLRRQLIAHMFLYGSKSIFEIRNQE